MIEMSLAMGSSSSSSSPPSCSVHYYDRNKRLDPNIIRHRFHTKVSFILTFVTLTLLVCISVLYHHHDDGPSSGNYYDVTTSSGRRQRWLDQLDGSTVDDDGIGGGGTGNDDDDYSQYSCRYIYDEVPQKGDEQCKFARTCNGGDGVWAPIVFCSSTGLSVYALFAMLSPVMILWMVILFRLLGSTAEDFFSPSLEMFSTKLGLPPRFAGVTLLALGNGAADVSATMSAIVNDEENGYNLSLGALSGAAMLVGCVVSGVIIIIAGGVPCRGALVRDVTALAVTIGVVWSQLSKGVITSGTITLFLSLYGIFVTLVLAADIYHRAVVVPQLRATAASLAAAEQAAASGLPGPTLESLNNNNNNNTMDPPSAFMRFITAFSNYDNTGQLFNSSQQQQQQDDCLGGDENGEMDVGEENLVAEEGMVGLVVPPPQPSHNIMAPSTDLYPRQQQHVTTTHLDPLGLDETIILHGQHGILHGDGHVPASATTVDSTTDAAAEAGAYTLVEDHFDQICSGHGSYGIPSSSWGGALNDGKKEVSTNITELWEEATSNDELKLHEKLLLIGEFPFTVVRKATIPVPCEGYYNRGFIALSMVVSPFWFAYYMLEHEMNMLSVAFLPYFLVYWGSCTVIGALILRFAPGGEGNMRMIFAAPVALYGFVMAATWIDFIANHLVSLLDFMGIVLHIPGTIMGLTVLAWGNSMGDLSANMTMARKGLANMAMTACFAGPVFNILMGLGLGFSSLARRTGKAESVVSLSSPVVTGFIFVVVNCVSILLVGIFIGKGRIEPYYGYIAVGLYGIYVLTSIALEIGKK